MKGGKMKENRTKMPPQSNTQYIVAVVTMLFIAITAIVVVISLRPDLDFLVVVAAVSGIFTPTTLSLLAFMKSEQTHLSVNSRLSAFIENAERASLAEGKEAGMKSANDRTDLLAANRLNSESPVEPEFKE
jgi:hypothetical protein